MPSHEGFLQAICAEPDDDTHRLIYADWLEEHGDPDRAEFIRVQIEIARLTEDDARMPSLRQREGELLARSGRTWRADLPTADGIAWGYFERGFMASLVANTEADFNLHAPALFALAPVQALQLGTIWEMAYLLASLCTATNAAPHMPTIPAIAPFLLLPVGGLNLVAGIACGMALREIRVTKTAPEELYTPRVEIPRLESDDGAASKNNPRGDPSSERIRNSHGA